MVVLSSVLALAGVLSLFLPGRLYLLALSFAILAVGCGLAVYRDKRRGPVRLAGALASFVGAAAGLLAVTKVALTLAAVEHLQTMLGS